MPYTVQMKEVNFGYIPGHGACRRRNFSGGGTFQTAELFRRRILANGEGVRVKYG